MNMQQSKGLAMQVLQKAQEAAKSSNSPDIVMNTLENLTPEIKQRLSNNKTWQSMRGKSTQEITQNATNLMRDPSIITSVLGSISPEMGAKVQNSPILNTLCSKSPAEMGGFVVKIAKTFGFI